MTRTELQSLADQKAEQYGIPPALFRGMIAQESGWNPRIVSNKGAAGLGQLMPGTATGLGVRDRFDPEANLDGSARYLKAQYDRFGSWDLALAAYNAGPGAVQKAGDQIPRIRETENYVKAILGEGDVRRETGDVSSTKADVAGLTPHASRLSPALPWWLDGQQVDQFHQQLGLGDGTGSTAAAPEKSAPLPWWLDGQQVDGLHQQLGLTADSSQAPTSAAVPSAAAAPAAPRLGFTPGHGLPQEIQASFSAPSFAPTAAPAPPRAPAAPSLAGTLLAGALAGPGGNSAQVGAGISRGQVALPPNPTAPAGLPLAASQRVQQIQGSATGPLAEAIQRYAAQTGGRSYVQDLLMRYRLAPDPVSRQAVLNEAGAYGLGPQIAQIASSLPPSV